MDVPLPAVVKAAARFVVTILAGVAILIAVLGLVTWLPHNAGFGR